MTRADEQIEGMEATAANLVRLLGEDGARALAQAFGGRRLYVPRQPGAHHPITVAVGQQAAERLAAAFHGVGIDVPVMPATRTEIRRLDAEGLTRADIARKLGITERWVYKTLAEAPSLPSRQGRLFG
jgi:DNA-binding transcriptional regulator LsrR (DeoR family)